MTAPPTDLPRDDTLPESLPAFLARFPHERACETFLRRWKYGDAGFRCPGCGMGDAWYLPSRRLDECRKCGKQTSLTAGTVFHKSTSPLRTWFLAIRLFTSSKQGISATELAREIGISYPTAWTWLHKLRGAVGQRAMQTLRGVVEVDETLEGGRDVGHQGGRGTEKKTVVGGAVEILPGDEGFGRCRLAVLPDASADSLKVFLSDHVAPGSALLTDGWVGYNAEATRGVDHYPIAIDGSGKKAHEVLPAVHRVFSLLGRVLACTYQGAASRAYLPLYLAEYEFRFNRRHAKSRALLFQRALSAAVLRAPATYWELIGRDNPRRRAAAA